MSSISTRAVAPVAAVFVVLLGGARATIVDDASPIVAGVVIDARSKAPVHDFALEIRFAAGMTRVLTDAAGRFQAAVGDSSGEIEIVLVDQDDFDRASRIVGLDTNARAPRSRHAWKPGAGDLVLEAAVGPEFALEVAPLAEGTAPIALATCRARLFVSSGDVVEESVSNEAPVHPRGENAAWVRFAPAARAVMSSANAQLVVESQDGLYRAESSVTDAVSNAHDRIHLAWTPCARWTGVVREPTGHALRSTWLTLEHLGEKGQIIERLQTRTDAEGRYAFNALAPGNYVIKGRPLRYREFKSMRRTLTALQSAKLDVTTEGVPIAGALAGRIEGAAAESGLNVQPTCALVLRRSGETLPLDEIHPEWKLADQRWVADFTFADLPADSFQIDLVAPAADDNILFEPRTIVARAPSTSLLFARR